MELVKNNWYAVCTKTRWEKKVAKQLEQKGIEYYCPLVKVERQWSDRKKIVLEPLFACYVFVRIQEKDSALVRRVDGCVNFVYWLKKPAIIRNEEIEAIRQFLNEHERIRVEKTKVNLADEVRIISGPLMEREGKVIEVKSRTVKVLLPSLGFTLVAELDKQHVQLVTSLSKIDPVVSLANGF
ncbi:MAG TPA: UpxY family transcription antiterminator [Puia sp.]